MRDAIIDALVVTNRRSFHRQATVSIPAAWLHRRRRSVQGADGRVAVSHATAGIVATRSCRSSAVHPSVARPVQQIALCRAPIYRQTIRPQMASLTNRGHRLLQKIQKTVGDARIVTGSNFADSGDNNLSSRLVFGKVIFCWSRGQKL